MYFLTYKAYAYIFMRVYILSKILYRPSGCTVLCANNYIYMCIYIYTYIYMYIYMYIYIHI